jgi:uncharacterized secreted protein with C-terminal beta-propeller domain
MRTRRLGEHIRSITHGALAAALTLMGALAPGAAPGAGPSGGPTATAGLTPFASCAALRQWYVDRTVDQVGPNGWYTPMYALRAPLPEGHAETATSGAGDAVANGPTGTNVQEAGVDEPDVAKTDGRIVVRVRGREVVVTDARGTVAHDLATWHLPAGLVAGGLLLVDGHVLITASRPFGMEDGAFQPDVVRSETTDLFDLDVTEPGAPSLAGHLTWSGSELSMRQYGDTVRLVTSTGLPDLPFVHPHHGMSSAAAAARNREVVRSAAIDQWLPSVRVGGGTRRAVDCASTYHAASSSRLDAATTVAVFTLHPGDDRPVSSVAVTGSGSQVYSSTDRLYVWSTDAGSMLRHPMRRDLAGVRPLMAPHTVVHAFAVDGDRTRYLASGQVDGEARDSWSFDEHDGHLRIALSWPRRSTLRDPDNSTSGADNGIAVLDVQGDRLVTVGLLRGLGRDEEIQSVRWFDDLAVLVTFRQTDPLFTADVADATRPRALGALHLPGFSSYLHPIGNALLLGLGTAATSEGQAQGAKAAVFDLADTSHVRELGGVSLGRDSWLQVANDPHAFTWLPAGEGAGTAITQLGGAADGVAMIALRVDADGHVTVHHLQGAGGWSQRALPLDDGRVALVGDRVVLVGSSGDLD